MGVNWRQWGKEAFDDARRMEKPLLLSISATWCHWCHVMDEKTYSDPKVVARIEQDFIPVRVDADRRPDIDRRYNMGGWPTTAFLTPDGTYYRELPTCLPGDAPDYGCRFGEP